MKNISNIQLLLIVAVIILSTILFGLFNKLIKYEDVLEDYNADEGQL